MEITNQLTAIRKRRGLSASALADLVGVSRQTIYAVEAGTYIPNTAVALRLSQSLGVTVEELFSLLPEVSQPRFKSATILPHSEELQPGQAVELCNVNGKLIAAASAPASWYFPPSDAVIGGSSPVRGSARIQFHQSEAEFGHRILLAGCDPAMGLVSRFMSSSDVELVAIHQNSSQSLSLLKGGFAHIAGSHLREEEDGSADSNLVSVNKLFPSGSAALISFAVWQEGLATDASNPKNIAGVEDLARPDIAFVNREAGSGIRALLDRHLKRLKINSKRVQGHMRTAQGHLAAACEVKSTRADCCLTTEASARFFGLKFIPLECVRYDLVVRKQHLAIPAIQTFFDAMNQLTFRRKLANLGGYDTSVTGARIQ